MKTSDATLGILPSILEVYQDTIRYLLTQYEFPGVSSDTVKLFKSQLGNSAFTCRLKGCPRATLGFSSERLLSDHESSHLRLFTCPDIGCQNLPSMSLRALKQHKKSHQTQVPTPRLRRIPHLQESQKTHLQYQMPHQQAIQQEAPDIGQTIPLDLAQEPNETVRPAVSSVPQSTEDLSPADQAKVIELAIKLHQQCPESQKNHYRNLVTQRFGKRAQEYSQAGKDPVLIWFQHQAFQGLTKNMRMQRNRQLQLNGNTEPDVMRGAR